MCKSYYIQCILCVVSRLVGGVRPLYKASAGVHWRAWYRLILYIHAAKAIINKTTILAKLIILTLAWFAQRSHKQAHYNHQLYKARDWSTALSGLDQVCHGMRTQVLGQAASGSRLACYRDLEGRPGFGFGVSLTTRYLSWTDLTTLDVSIRPRIRQTSSSGCVSLVSEVKLTQLPESVLYNINSEY